jgi:uncharacterized iron-regulated membrane protein
VVASAVVISYPWASALVYRAVGERPPAPAGESATRAPARGGDAGAGAPREGNGGATRAPAAPLLPTGTDAYVARAGARMPGWKSITMQLPKPGASSVALAVDGGSGGQPQRRATITFDAASGRELKWESFATQTPGRRLRSILRFAHTGEVLGIVGQTIAGLVSLGALFLAYTGIALSLRRFAAWRRRAA